MKRNFFFSFVLILILVLAVFSLSACFSGLVEKETGFTVTFDGSGGEHISGELSQDLEYGEKATAPVFEKEGYSLSWDNPFVYITSDLDIKAVWKLKFFQVSFETNKDFEVEPLSVPYNSKRDIPSPQSEDFRFSGWFYDELFKNSLDFDDATNTYYIPSMPANDLVLYALWVELYAVKFESNGGSKISTVYVAEGELIPAPEENPTRNNFSFDGWFLDEELQNPIDFETFEMGNEPITLFAKWNAI